jgi:tRNA1Val (adenine37-N6)-methyltransferase
MSNTYFQFKQFRIEQGSTAMKVTTDACIQGAWTPLLSGTKDVLDIGAGTGLLSLMLAQRNPEIEIDAVEYELASAQQANENVTASHWRDRINVVNADVRNFAKHVWYDLIISNPPFFSNSLKSETAGKALARHTDTLSFSELASAMILHLRPDGYCSVLLPVAEYLTWCSVALSMGLHEFGRLEVKHTETAQVKRVVGLFRLQPAAEVNKQMLTIKSDDGTYTQQFTELMSPFYLDL